MAASNDLRGWVMSAVSGVACILGSAVVCADLVFRRFSHRKDFQIVTNNGFLSASLCLSAGVMLFTSLYSMLPTSKRYLTKAGWSPRASAYALIGLFLAGVIVIRLLSGLIHRYIPSHVVDCAHTHEPEHDPERGQAEEPVRGESENLDVDGSTERTPLLKRMEPRSFKSTPAVLQAGQAVPRNLHKKEPLRMRLTRQLSMLVGGVKPLCDENGPCYGFSQTCGGECTKTLIAKPTNLPDENAQHLRHHRSMTRFEEPTWPGDDEESGTLQVPARWPRGHPRAFSEGAQRIGYLDGSSSSSHSEFLEHHCKSPNNAPSDDVHDQHQQGGEEEEEDHEDHQHSPQHHHHVPQNAFLAIGLQTSVAIALHKLPEGFITYATNHASPTLGMTVFLALFIHNISEGFAMALPLYLALNSRWKAMFWSSLLGGVSQPAGAGLAALWIWGSQKASGDHGSEASGPSWGVYGGMFAATAGIMTSVALQLFSEGLSLTHNRNLGIGFAIAGMGLMGLSFALTA